MTQTPTTDSRAHVRAIAAMTGPGLFSLRVESRRHVWDAELDMSEAQMLSMAQLAGVALRDELGPQWVPGADTITILTPPELDAPRANAMQAAILSAICKGFARND